MMLWFNQNHLVWGCWLLGLPIQRYFRNMVFKKNFLDSVLDIKRYHYWCMKHSHQLEEFQKEHMSRRLFTTPKKPYSQTPIRLWNLDGHTNFPVGGWYDNIVKSLRSNCSRKSAFPQTNPIKSPQINLCETQCSRYLDLRPYCHLIRPNS